MSNQKKTFLILLIVVTGITLFLIRDFLMVIALALLFVLMFNPIYKWLLLRTKGNQGIATSLIMLIILLSVIIPIIFVGFVTAYQVTEVASDLQTSQLSSGDYGEVINGFIEQINVFLQNNSINYTLTIDEINTALNQVLRSGGGFLLSYGAGFGARLPELFAQIILFIVFLSYLFPAQRNLLDSLKKLSPLSNEINRIFISRASAMARSMVNGTFVVALIQAIIGALLLWILGIPYVLFFFLLLFILSIIPVVGSGIVLIPAGIILILTGDILGGVVVLFMQFIVISNIDNILRPKLVEEDARLPEALTLVSILSGLGIFGIMGLIFGPVIMVIAYTTYEIYMKYYATSVKNFLNSDKL
jgi:predicted PurR-regulated permease PerM